MHNAKKKFQQAVIIAAAVCCLAFAFLLWRSPAFSAGEEGYELYRQGHCAAPVIGQGIWAKLLQGEIAGEGTRYRGDQAAEIISRYRARLRFVEEAAGTVSYYLYSPELTGGVLLRGAWVNLHIAVGEDTTVGTPVIFSSF